jgi:hypothetical protein
MQYLDELFDDIRSSGHSARIEFIE